MKINTKDLLVTGISLLGAYRIGKYVGATKSVETFTNNMYDWLELDEVREITRLINVANMRRRKAKKKI